MTGAAGVLVLYAAVGVGCAVAALAARRSALDVALLLLLWPLSGPFVLMAGARPEPASASESLPLQLRQLQYSVADELARGADEHLRKIRYREELKRIETLLRRLTDDPEPARPAESAALRDVLTELSRRVGVIRALATGSGELSHRDSQPTNPRD